MSADAVSDVNSGDRSSQTQLLTDLVTQVRLQNENLAKQQWDKKFDDVHKRISGLERNISDYRLETQAFLTGQEDIFKNALQTHKEECEKLQMSTGEGMVNPGILGRKPGWRNNWAILTVIGCVILCLVLMALGNLVLICGGSKEAVAVIDATKGLKEAVDEKR